MKIFLKSVYNFELNDEFPGIEFTSDENRFPEVEIIISNNHGYTSPETIENCGKLKLFQSVSAGFDNVDLDYLRSRGIRFCRCSCLGGTIAEDIILKILYFSRRYDAYLKYQRERVWFDCYKMQNVCELGEKTVGFIGVGDIAEEAAKRLKAFNMTVLGYRRSNVESPYFDKIFHGGGGLDEMIRRSDYLVVTIPLSPDTHGLVDRRRLEIVKDNCILVNVSRGKVIDEEALIEALQSGRIRAAALDVFSQEPLPQGSPLWSMENVLISPHSSSITDMSAKKAKEFVADNIRRYIAGQEMRCIVV